RYSPLGVLEGHPPEGHPSPFGGPAGSPAWTDAGPFSSVGPTDFDTEASVGRVSRRRRDAHRRRARRHGVAHPGNRPDRDDALPGARPRAGPHTATPAPCVRWSADAAAVASNGPSAPTPAVAAWILTSSTWMRIRRRRGGRWAGALSSGCRS